MKTSTVRGLRTAVAASGVAMLMFVAGCGDSGETTGDDTEQSADADANGEESAAEGDSSAEGDSAAEDDSAAEEPAEDDSAAEEEPAEDDSAAEEEPAEDEGGSDPAASGAVAPAEDFDPCTVLDAGAVSDTVGFDVEEGASEELMGGLNCTFVGADGAVASVLVQWIPIENDLDTMVESVEGTYENIDGMTELDLTGASDARAFTAEVMSQQAAVVFASVDGGMFQVMVMSEDGTLDQAQALTEQTLASV